VKLKVMMTNFHSVVVFLLLTAAPSCAAPASSPMGGSGSTTGNGSGSGGTSGGNGGSSTLGGGGGTSGFDAFFGTGYGNGANLGTGGSTRDGTGGASVDASVGDGNSDQAPARMCLAALGEDAPGVYDWNACCPNETATAQEWCTHYASFCKFNFPLSSNLSPGAVPLKDMADCLTRFPPLTLKSRACRSNFLCSDSQLGQATDKACDFADLNRRKCDGL
jgi:hypothetical protein